MRLSATMKADFFTQFVIPATRSLTAAAAALTVAACAVPQGGAQSPGGGAAAPGGARQSIVSPEGPVSVALLAPTSAGNSAMSRAAQDITAAAQIAMSRGSNTNFSMKIYDTHGTADGAAAAAAHAVREGAALIVGPLTADNTRIVAPIARQAGLNVISFSNDTSVAGGNVWVAGQTPDDELRRLLSYAGSQGLRNVALVHPFNAYGDAVAGAAASAGRDAGVQVSPVNGYPRSFEGIQGISSTAAANIRSSGGDGVIIADSGDALRSMASFLGYYDVAPSRFRYMGLSRWDDSGNYSESMLQGGWFVAPDPTASGIFTANFESMLNRRPSPVASLGYDAIVAAHDMLSDAKAGGAPAFSAASITGGSHAGATGPFRFTRDGRNMRSYAVMQITGSGPQILDPAPAFAPGS